MPRHGRILPLLAALTAALYVLAAACSGGDSVPPEQEFRDADQAMAEVIDHLERGDIDAAFAAFPQPHDLTHQIDDPLRERDANLAQRLEDAVLTMESFESTDEELLAAARDVRRYLREAAETFGYTIDA